MAIYEWQLEKIGRSEGRNAVAASAYRGGGCLTNHRTGTEHDYSRRRGIRSEIILPAGVAFPQGHSAPVTMLQKRSYLWNQAERTETRKNAVVAREIMVAVPYELTAVQGASLLRRYGTMLANRLGVAAELAQHDPSRWGDPRNRHGHILFTTREVRDGIVLGAKTRELDAIATGGALIKALRQQWADMANEALHEAGRSERIDSRSLADRGIDREPNVHLGPQRTHIIRMKRDMARRLHAEADAIGFSIAAAAWPQADFDDPMSIEPGRVARGWRKHEEEERRRSEEAWLERVRTRKTRLKEAADAKRRLDRYIAHEVARMGRVYGESIADLLFGGASELRRRIGPKPSFSEIAKHLARDPRDRSPSGQRRLAHFLKDAMPKAMAAAKARNTISIKIVDASDAVGKIDPIAAAAAATVRKTHPPSPAPQTPAPKLPIKAMPVAPRRPGSRTNQDRGRSD